MSKSAEKVSVGIPPRTFAESPRRVQTAEIPIPPSTNHLFRATFDRKTGRPKRVVTDEYQAFRIQADIAMRGQLKPCLRYPVEVEVRIVGGLGFPESRDCDNTAKAVLGSLKEALIIKSDSVRWVNRTIQSYERPSGRSPVATCRVIITEAPGE